MKLFSKSTVRVQAKSAICCMFPVQPVVNVLFWQSHFLLTWGGWVAFSKINSVAVLTAWPLKSQTSPDKVHQREGTASKDALAGAWLTFPVSDTHVLRSAAEAGMALKFSKWMNEKTFHVVCRCVMGSSFSTRLSLRAERVHCLPVWFSC